MIAQLLPAEEVATLFLNFSGAASRRDDNHYLMIVQLLPAEEVATLL
jgi:hypothetical protein